MNFQTPARTGGMLLCLLFITSLCQSQVITVTNGSWTSGATWSTGAVPGPGDDVIVRHRITFSGSTPVSVTVNSLTIENGTRNDDAYVSFNDGSASRSLHILNDLHITATANFDCRLQAQGANTAVTVDRDIFLYRNHPGFVEVFGIRLRTGSSMTARNMTIDYIYSGDDNQEVYLRENSSMVLSGDVLMNCIDGNEEISIDITDASYFECNNLTGLLAGSEALSGVGRDIELRVWDDATAVIHGNLVLTRTGGRRIEITLGDGAPCTAILLVEGNMELRHLNGLDHTNKYLTIDATGDASLTVLGNVTAISNSERELEFVFTNNSVLDIEGDLYLESSAIDNLKINAYGTSRFFFGGDIIVNTPISPNPNVFYFSYTGSNITTVTFKGNGNQTVPAETYGNLIIDNPQYVTLEGDIIVASQLSMLNGKVLAAGKKVNMLSGAGITGSSGGYICNGILRRDISSGGPYWFYVGDTARGYSPVVLKSLTATSVFEVKYYPENPDDAGYITSARVPALEVISRLEYWMINRVSGTGIAQVSLGWNASSGVNSAGIDDLLIGHWDGTKWTSLGDCVASGNASAGMVESTSASPGFSPFTLASSGSMNILENDGISLTATPGKNGVHLQWTSQTTAKPEGYYLERSADGATWEPLAFVANGNQFLDEQPLACKSYYRLRPAGQQVRVQYSKAVQVMAAGNNTTKIFPSPARAGQDIQITVSGCTTGPVKVQVYDITGKLIVSRMITPAGNSIILSTALPGIGKGLIFIRVQHQDRIFTRQVLIY